MEKPYRMKKKLIMTGGSYALVIPRSWLKRQAERLKKKIVEVFDLFIYDRYLEIRPTK